MLISTSIPLRFVKIPDHAEILAIYGSVPVLFHPEQKQRVRVLDVRTVGTPAEPLRVVIVRGLLPGDTPFEIARDQLTNITAIIGKEVE